MRHLISQNVNKLLFSIMAILFGLDSNACTIEIPSSSVSLNWDRNFSFHETVVQVKKVSFNSCTVKLGISKGNSTSYNRTALMSSNSFDYNVYKTNQLISPLKDGEDVINSDEYIELIFPEGENVVQNVSLFLGVDYSLVSFPIYRPTGLYTDQLDIRAYLSSPMNTPIASASLGVVITASQILELSLVPTNHSFDAQSYTQSINLGDLEYSREANFDLIIRTNTGYKISVSSDNGGKLSHSTYPTFNSIPYTFSLNYVNHSLTNIPTVVDSFLGQSDGSGQVNRIKVVTQQASEVASGEYSDRIIIIIEPND